MKTSKSRKLAMGGIGVLLGTFGLTSLGGMGLSAKAPLKMTEDSAQFSDATRRGGNKNGIQRGENSSDSKASNRPNKKKTADNKLDGEDEATMVGSPIWDDQENSATSNVGEDICAKRGAFDPYDGIATENQKLGLLDASSKNELPTFDVCEIDLDAEDDQGEEKGQANSSGVPTAVVDLDGIEVKKSVLGQYNEAHQSFDIAEGADAFDVAQVVLRAQPGRNNLSGMADGIAQSDNETERGKKSEQIEQEQVTNNFTDANLEQRSDEKTIATFGTAYVPLEMAAELHKTVFKRLADADMGNNPKKTVPSYTRSMSFEGNFKQLIPDMLDNLTPNMTSEDDSKCLNNLQAAYSLMSASPSVMAILLWLPWPMEDILKLFEYNEETESICVYPMHVFDSLQTAKPLNFKVSNLWTTNSASMWLTVPMTASEPKYQRMEVDDILPKFSGIPNLVEFINKQAKEFGVTSSEILISATAGDEVHGTIFIDRTDLGSDEEESASLVPSTEGQMVGNVAPQVKVVTYDEGTDLPKLPHKLSHLHATFVGPVVAKNVLELAKKRIDGIRAFPKWEEYNLWEIANFPKDFKA